MAPQIIKVPENRPHLLYAGTVEDAYVATMDAAFKLRTADGKKLVIETVREDEAQFSVHVTLDGKNLFPNVDEKYNIDWGCSFKGAVARRDGMIIKFRPRGKPTMQAEVTGDGFRQFRLIEFLGTENNTF